MVGHRTGETGMPIPARHPRVFQKTDGFWYFLTREKTEVGPFPTDEAAAVGVEDYAGFSQDVDRVYLDDVDMPVGDGLAELLSRHSDAVSPIIDNISGERLSDTAEAVTQRQSRLFSSRVFFRDNTWFFFTREGRDIGPFESRDVAEKALVKYVDFAGDLDRVIHDAYRDASGQVSDSL
jgi:hypothetical protein